MHKAFLETKRRPFPLPERPWVMTQTWHHLLFCHWPIEKEVIQELLPPELELDTYRGKAWLGVVPFKVKNMRMRGLPRVPYLHTVLQVNIRTYVTYKGISGIYFLTIDANKRLAVWGARIGALLPYRKASIRMTTRKDGIHFQSVSRELNQDKEKLDILYHPVSNAYTPSLNSLENWLFERYCFFVVHHKKVYRGDIHHDRWQVKRADVKINHLPTNFIFSSIQNEPLCHYTRKKQAFAWILKRIH